VQFGVGRGVSVALDVRGTRSGCRRDPKPPLVPRSRSWPRLKRARRSHRSPRAWEWRGYVPELSASRPGTLKGRIWGRGGVDCGAGIIRFVARAALDSVVRGFRARVRTLIPGDRGANWAGGLRQIQSRRAGRSRMARCSRCSGVVVAERVRPQLRRPCASGGGARALSFPEAGWVLAAA